MLELIMSLLGGGNGLLAALAAGLAAAIGLYVKGRSDGKAKADAKTLKGKLAAKDAQLEMNREATVIEREVTGLTDQDARKEAERWSRRS